LSVIKGFGPDAQSGGNLSDAIAPIGDLSNQEIRKTIKALIDMARL